MIRALSSNRASSQTKGAFLSHIYSTDKELRHREVIGSSRVTQEFYHIAQELRISALCLNHKSRRCMAGELKMLPDKKGAKSKHNVPTV